MTARGRPASDRSQTTPELSTLATLLTASERAAATRRPPRRPVLLNWSEILPWQQDNHYLLKGYRQPTDSFVGCFQSLFYLHNESVNIHSHLLGVFLFFFIAMSIYYVESYHLLWSDGLALACFFVSVITCLGISAVYHLISNHSPEVARLGNQLDYIGIVILIAGSFVPSIYYGFYCEPSLQRRYWSMVGGS